MMRAFLILLFIICSSGNLLAQQRMLQIEKYGSTKVIRLYPGDELKVRLHGDDEKWRFAVIDELLIDKKMIRFDFGLVEIEEIRAIRTSKQMATPKFVKKTLLYFGVGLILLSPLNLIQGLDYPTGLALGVGGGSIAAAFLFDWILTGILTHRFGKRKWLRLLEVPFEPPILERAFIKGNVPFIYDLEETARP
jgi:hypothetical protein